MCANTVLFIHRGNTQTCLIEHHVYIVIVSSGHAAYTKWHATSNVTSIHRCLPCRNNWKNVCISGVMSALNLQLYQLVGDYRVSSSTKLRCIRTGSCGLPLTAGMWQLPSFTYMLLGKNTYCHNLCPLRMHHNSGCVASSDQSSQHLAGRHLLAD